MKATKVSSVFSSFFHTSVLVSFYLYRFWYWLQDRCLIRMAELGALSQFMVCCSRHDTAVRARSCQGAYAAVVSDSAFQLQSPSSQLISRSVDVPKNLSTFNALWRSCWRSRSNNCFKIAFKSKLYLPHEFIGIQFAVRLPLLANFWLTVKCL